ncbi:MAG TPA: group III truncated hemoglobin [Methylocella sp.]|nr:group III truncated hemoglobin [Methylocella sp.]
MTEGQNAEMEEAIRICVGVFYGKARQDPLIGPIFNKRVADWDVHLQVIANFWSKVLLKTDRYNGSPFPLHRNLPVELEHFDRWLALFEETVKATLPGEYAAKALAKARHMGESFKAGIFPFTDQNGSPARHPG